MMRIVHQRQPPYDIALNGVRQIVHGIGLVGKPKVDHGDGFSICASIAPHQIRRMPIVVSPQWRQGGQQRQELRMKWLQERERFIAAFACSQIFHECRPRGNVAIELHSWVVRGEDRKPGHKLTPQPRGRLIALRCQVKPRQRLAR